MKQFCQISGVALIMLALAGCYGSSGKTTSSAPILDFTTFVKAQVNNPNVDRDAVDINRLEFRFNDQNDEQAYADLF